MSHRAIRAVTPEQPGEPIDLGHLRTQTCGDAALEADLLDLFSRQARMILRDLAAAAAVSATRQREADLLHTLCGSARAVGAWEVATGAEQLERIARETPADETSPDPRPGPDLMAALDGSVERACQAIDDLRATASEDRSERGPTRR